MNEKFGSFFVLELTFEEVNGILNAESGWRNSSFKKNRKQSHGKRSVLFGDEPQVGSFLHFLV